MEPTINPITLKYRYAANYGLILGGYLTIFYILQILFNGSAVINVLNTLSIIATPVICYYLAKKYRDNALNGYIQFGQVWSFGIWLFLFAGLIMAVVYFVHFKFINPDFISDTFNQTMLMLEKMNYPKASLDLLSKNGLPTPIQMVFSYLFAYIILGAILFLFISPLVAKKKPDDFLGKSEDDKPYEPYKDENKTPESNS
jgi:hypothetical protein